MDGHPEVIGDLAEADTDVARVAEPELATMRQAGGDRLGDEPPGVAEAGRDVGGSSSPGRGSNTSRRGKRRASRSESGKAASACDSWPPVGAWTRCNRRQCGEVVIPSGSSGSPSGSTPRSERIARYSSTTITARRAGHSSSDSGPPPRRGSEALISASESANSSARSPITIRVRISRPSGVMRGSPPRRCRRNSSSNSCPVATWPLCRSTEFDALGAGRYAELGAFSPR